MLVILDLDGTLCRGDYLFPDAINLVNFVERENKVVFLSNISTKTSVEVANKLKQLGFSVSNNVYTSSSEAVRYLADNRYDNVYVIGSESFKSEILNSGIGITDKAAVVVVGLDYSFSYDMIEKAVSIVLAGGKFVVCNEDTLFPTKGRLKPGLGVITGAIEKVVGRPPDFIIGKPGTYIVENIMKDYGVDVKDVVIVGDSEEDDILVAERIGCTGILVIDGPDHFLPVYSFLRRLNE